MKRLGVRVGVLVGMALCGAWSAAGQTGEAGLRAEAAAALKKAVGYYRGKVAAHGGYVYHYSLDLRQRWGEGVANADQAWVQPPGTPTVGMAYLRAHAATGDPTYLDAARETAEALVYGQLKSGGWANCIDFDPKGSKVSLYRNGKGGGRNQSSLDDGTTQAALRFLAAADQALQFKNPAVHEAAQTALDALLKAQFPNGAFPQGWQRPVTAQPVVKAGYPPYDWRTEGRVDNYWDYYTLNDGLAGTVAATLKETGDIYQDERCRAALKKLGDFLILAQMPEPQPAWAQQYSYTMFPIWARRFEPAAVTGGESQDVIETLLKLYRWTGDAKYLQPIPTALAYLKRSVLPEGRLARYYELKTNRPLYMNRRGRDYFLTFDDKDLPDHYGWKIPSRLAQLEKEYNEARQGRKPDAPSPVELEREARKAVQELDAEGRWISTYTGERVVGQPKFPPSFKYLSSELFSRNITVLSDYLAATRKQ